MKQSPRRNPKVGIICSHGGHFTQAMYALEAFKGFDCFAVVPQVETLRDLQIEGVRKIYPFKIIGRYSWPVGVFINMAIATFRFWKIFYKERPDFLFSTGAEIAVPAFYLAKWFFGAKLIFLESLTRISDPSLAGRWIYPVADLFLVQHEAVAQKYGKKAIYKGALI